MTNRLRLSVPLVAVFLWIGCIDVPDIVDPPEPPDAGGALPDGGSTPDGGGAQSPDFELGVSPTEDSALQGGTKSFQVNLVRKQGFSGTVSVALVNPPQGISAPAVTIPTTGNLGTLTVTVAASVAPGPVALTVRGIAGAVSREQVVSLTVVPLGELAVSWVSPSESLSSVNGSLSVEVSVEGGQPETVELLKGDTVLTAWTSPPYTYAWDTRSELEGEHLLSARATRAGGTFTSVTRTVVVDRTAPQVATWTPTRGATLVSVHTTVQATFSEPLRASSVTASNVGLSGNGGVALAASGELSADGRTLTLTALSPLPVSSTVSVRLGTTENPLTDLAGNPLGASGAWSFTVPYWLPMGGAISAYPGNTSAENVVMKVGTDGAPVIAWSESDGVTKNIHVARWDGMQWLRLGGTIQTRSAPGTHAEHPALAHDSSGRILVAWDEKSEAADNRSVHVAMWTGATWQDLAVPPLPSNEFTSTTHPYLALTPAGVTILYARVKESDAGTRTEGCALGAGATAWTPLYLLLPAGHFNREATSLAAASTNILAAYSTFVDAIGTRAITVVRNHEYPLGSPLISNPTDSSATNASIVADGAGEPRIVWEEHRDDTTISNIFFSQWTGSAWLSPVRITSETTANTSPSLALAEDGNPVVAWSGFTPPAKVIFVARYDGSVWNPVGPALSAEGGASTPGTQPVLVLDDTGHPIVGWVETTAAGTNIYVSRENR